MDKIQIINFVKYYFKIKQFDMKVWPSTMNDFVLRKFVLNVLQFLNVLHWKGLKYIVKFKVCFILASLKYCEYCDLQFCWDQQDNSLLDFTKGKILYNYIKERIRCRSATTNSFYY